MGISLKWEKLDSMDEFHAEILPRVPSVHSLLLEVNPALLPAVDASPSPFPFPNHSYF